MVTVQYEQCKYPNRSFNAATANATDFTFDCEYKTKRIGFLLLVLLDAFLKRVLFRCISVPEAVNVQVYMLTYQSGADPRILIGPRGELKVTRSSLASYSANHDVFPVWLINNCSCLQYLTGCCYDNATCYSVDSVFQACNQGHGAQVPKAPHYRSATEPVYVQVDANRLFRGEEVSRFLPSPDYVLMADVVYYEEVRNEVFAYTTYMLVHISKTLGEDVSTQSAGRLNSAGLNCTSYST